ncbi:MAG TPA: TetR/AcrR family transcriptional regulator [Aliiroseovarius sp.]|nr:TetR/AcrR family transcriptional regulator [Aliiroseovarius sp.]
MARIVKDPEDRKLEVILTAERLFKERGFKETSVDAIVQEMNVAKGTFYYYFKSKEAVLEAIVNRTLDQVVEMAQQVADAPSLDALSKMEMLLPDSHIGGEDTTEKAEYLHLPDNRELHEITNIQTILKLSPVFAQIVEQGNEEGVFKVARPLETIQFLLASSQFLLDGGLFDFDEQELRQRRLSMQDMIERSLGAAPGSFGFMNPSTQKE